MKNDESQFETVIRDMYHSPKIRNTLSAAAIIGIAACIAVLLPPVQKAMLAFVGTVIDLSSHSMEALQGRLSSLLSLAFWGIAVLLFLLCCLHARRIEDLLSDSKSDRIISGLGLGAAFLGLVFVTAFSYRYGRQWLNSDHSSEMVLGKLLAGENALVSRQWHYSTELRLIYQTIFSMPLFKLFGGLNNWTFIRSAVICLNGAVLIAAYIFLMRQMGSRSKWVYASAVFLLAPLSLEYWGIVTFGGYYVFFIVQNFCCLGLFFKLTSLPPADKQSRRDFILFSLLSFALGVQSIRSLLNIQIPLMLACFAVYRLNTVPQKKAPVYLGVYSFILCFAGFIVNFLLQFIYSFHTFESLQIDNLFETFFTKLGQNLVSLLSFFGFTGGGRVLSAQGIAAILTILFTVYLFWYMLNLLTQSRTGGITPPEDKRNGGAVDPRQFIIAYFFISIMFNVFVFQITEGDITSRYFIPSLILYIPLLVILFERTEKTGSAWSKTGLAAAVFLFILTQGAINFQELSGRDENRIRSGYIAYLSEHDLNFGFATFWNGNVTTELTNGKISVAGLEPHGLEPGERFNIQGWLNPQAFYERSYYEGESFLLLTRAEWDMALQTGRPFSKKTPDYDDGEFIILRYPSAAIIHDTVLDK